MTNFGQSLAFGMESYFERERREREEMGGKKQANEARLQMCKESEAAMRRELEAKGLTEEQIERALGPIVSYRMGVEEEMDAEGRGR